MGITNLIKQHITIYIGEILLHSRSSKLPA